MSIRPGHLRRLAESEEEIKIQTSVWKIYKRLVRYVFKHKKQVFLAFIAICAVSLLNFSIPQLTRIVIDDVIVNKDYGLLLWVSVAIISIAVLLGVFNFIGTYMMSVVGQSTIYDIRNQMYRHMQDLSMSFFENRRTGELMSRITNDVNTLQQLITSGVIQIFKDLLVFVVVLVYLLYADYMLTLLLLTTFPVMILSTKFFAKKIRGAYKEVQEQIANVNDHLQDTLSSMKLIKSFSNEDYETNRFEKRNYNSMKANIKAVKFWASYSPVIELLNQVGRVIILVFGAYRAISGAITVGELVAFTAYLRMLQQPVRSFSRVINVVQQAAAASERIFEIIDTQVEVVEKENAVELPRIKGNIQLENVYFSYKSSDTVLKNLNLTIEPGQTIALVGPSGAGKSTVTNLIARFYDPQEGRVRIDGYDVKDVTLKSLRGQMGMVTQEVLLLNGSVRDNIAYGKPDATMEEIERAARMANAHEFIMQLPKGYDTQIGERGIKLSGGQRQRLSIARALLKDPSFLILDEATSSLDTESEHLIQEALAVLLKNRTSLVIAHRLSTIQNADRIVVIDNGEIVEEGKHTELLALGGKYAQLYEMQFPQDPAKRGSDENAGSKRKFRPDMKQRFRV